MSIHARRKVQSVLDGEYGSVHRGRSLDFDDLRDYVVGDDVKDIDWKATARSGRPLVRRYVATRRHTVMLLVDTGRTMAALADPDDSKVDVAVYAAGIVGDIALRHGDSVGLVAGPVAAARNADKVYFVPASRGDAHLENVLRVIHGAVSPQGDESRLDALLDYAARHFRRRMIVVVIADDVSLSSRHEALLRRLATQHEVLFCAVGDVTMTDPALADRELTAIASAARIPAFFRRNDALHTDLVGLAEARARATATLLSRAGVASTRLGSGIDVPTAMIELLGRHRQLVRRRAT
jgi:uncharacterized protein (DUF58 family)